MSWSIGVRENTLKISPDVAEKLIVAGEDNYHCLAYDPERQRIEFDSDAMEHMDCVWEDWFLNVLNGTDSNGDVVFISSEGDNRGKIWGYRFKNGNMTLLTAQITMVEKNV